MIMASLHESRAASRHRCPRADELPRVLFSVNSGQLKTHSGFSQAQIQRMSRPSGRSVKSAGRRSTSRVVGRTVTSLNDKLVVGAVTVT